MKVNGHTPRISFSATGVEAVREFWQPATFLRRKLFRPRRLGNLSHRLRRGTVPPGIVKERSGSTGLTKILSGTNFCDVGFEVDEHANRVVVTAAIDNLMKGASGQAVQSMNIRYGFPEMAGLDFIGLHPV
ncbi:MAG: hypothetical protein R2849_10740 [Thermomicrobiales bacterium]